MLRAVRLLYITVQWNTGLTGVSASKEGVLTKT